MLLYQSDDSVNSVFSVANAFPEFVAAWYCAVHVK